MPAAFRSAGDRFCCKTRDQQRNAGRFARKRQAPARCQIVCCGLAPKLDEHSAKSKASYAFKRCLQGRNPIFYRYKYQGCRVQPKLDHALRACKASLEIRHRLAHPENWLFATPAYAYPEAEPAGSNRIPRRLRINFVT